MQIEDCEQHIDRGEASRIDEEELGNLRLTNRDPVGAESETEQELERIHIEQHYEHQRQVENDRRAVIESVSAEEDVLRMPDGSDRGKREREDGQATQLLEQLIELGRNCE